MNIKILRSGQQKVENVDSQSKIEQLLQVALTDQNFESYGVMGQKRVPSTPAAPKGSRLECEDKKKFACNICQLTFTKSYSLFRHMFLHSGERPFQCTVCDKGFIQKTDLQRHETTHTGGKDFICQFPGCLKAFSTKKNLTNHLLVHSNARPCK